MKREPKQGNPNGHDDEIQLERAVLGVLLERPELLPEAQLSIPDFLLPDHQKIYGAMCQLQTFDTVTLASALDGKVDPDYLASLFDVAHIAVNFGKYAKAVRQGALDRQFLRLQEKLENATNGDRLTLLQQMQQLLTAEDSQDWRSIFHTFADFENARPLSFAISEFLPADGIALIGGLSGHGKTLAMMAMARSLLTAEELFGWAAFSVPKPASRVALFDSGKFDLSVLESAQVISLARISPRRPAAGAHSFA
jgi:replicative DNA helicase